VTISALESNTIIMSKIASEVHRVRRIHWGFRGPGLGGMLDPAHRLAFGKGDAMIVVHLPSLHLTDLLASKTIVLEAREPAR